jgi:lipopolysaccharide biosynthesis protein
LKKCSVFSNIELFRTVFTDSSDMTKKSVCIFPHYYDLPSIPYYVRIYIKELENYFDEIVIVSNPREIENDDEVVSDKVRILFQNNEGYDYGKFLHAFHQLDLSLYHQVACINDSNIVFGELGFLFQWAEQVKPDFWGLVGADIRPAYSTQEGDSHIQSHFLVFNEKAIPLLSEYVQTINLEEITKIKDIKAAKRKVINDWEIGLSRFLVKQDLKVAAYINHADYEKTNQEQFYAWMIKQGVPVIKKKIITSVKPRDLLAGKNSWQSLICNFRTSVCEKDRLIDELKGIRNRHILRKLKR